MYSGFISQKLDFGESCLMHETEHRKKDSKTVDDGARRVLQEAEVVARWTKKPFYIS